MLGSEYLKDLESVKGLSQKANQFINKRLIEFPDGFRGQQILHDLKIPFLKMDIPDYDWKTMLKEGLELEEWAVAHRSDNSRGWKSLCLHGLDAEKTMSCDRYGFNGERDAPYKWTWAADKSPVTTKYLKGLFDAGYFSELYRVRFMYLEPGGYINFHRDREEGRNSLGPLNIALNMPENCHWIFEDWGFVPFEHGTAFAVDVSNKHGVWNQSDETRVHIIIHGRYGPAYYETLEKSVRHSRKAAKSVVATDSPPSADHLSQQKSNSPQIGAVLWQQNCEIAEPKLMSVCQNISEHFLKLKANRSIRLESGFNLSSSLEKLHSLGCDWAFVITPGTILKDGIFKELKHLVSGADDSVFLFGHLLDRKERWFGIHHQNFLVNLKAWKRVGAPSFSAGSRVPISLVNVERSEENVHDDYTPVHLKRGGGDDIVVTPKKAGWSWIDHGIRAGFEMKNFPESVRRKKLFLYPEKNSGNLLSRLNQPLLPMSELMERWPLDQDQEDIYEFLDMEYRGLERKMFVFNTEQVRPTYQQSHLKPLDAYIGLPAGFMDLHMLYRHKFHENTKLIYFDVNDRMLNLRKAMLQSWDGKDYPGFIRKYMFENREFFKTQLMTTDDEDLEEKWGQELDIWKKPEAFNEVFDRARGLPTQFITTNLLVDQSELLDAFRGLKNAHVAFWYSNCFNYTPGLALKNWDIHKLQQKGIELLNTIYNIAEKNNLEVMVYGEEVGLGVKGTSFGLEIRDIFG